MTSIGKRRMGIVVVAAMVSTVSAGWLSAAVANAEIAPKYDAAARSETTASTLSASATPQAAAAKDKDSDLFAGYMQKAGSHNISRLLTRSPCPRPPTSRRRAFPVTSPRSAAPLSAESAAGCQEG